MKKTTLTITIAAAMAATPGLWAQQSYTSPGSQQSSTSSTTESKLDHKTTKFLEQAFEDNRMEVSMADLGISKAQNPQLKSFCQTLKNDHQQANTQLMQIAQKEGANIDQSSTHKERHEMSKFNKLSGAEFDKEFATDALKSHQKDISRFEKASKDITDPEVKQYIDQTLPKLREHLQKAADVARSVGVDQSTISSALRKANESVGGTSESSSTSSGSASSKANTDSSTTK